MKLNEDQKKQVQQKLLRMGLKIVREAKKRCPVDTGRLRSSINTKLDESGYGIKVGSNVDYAPDVEFGTSPHIIKPKEAEALHWEDEDGDHFAQEVRHPGTPATPFLRPSIDKVLNNA